VLLLIHYSCPYCSLFISYILFRL